MTRVGGHQKEKRDEGGEEIKLGKNPQLMGRKEMPQQDTSPLIYTLEDIGYSA